MRKLLIPLAALMAMSAPAFSQTPAAQPPEPLEQEVAALSDEDKNAAPFPPGPNAALVNKVCSECHSGGRVVDLRYTREDAENFYKNMVGADIGTDQAKKIIEYLTTTLGAESLPG